VNKTDLEIAWMLDLLDSDIKADIIAFHMFKNLDIVNICRDVEEVKMIQIELIEMRHNEKCAVWDEEKIRLQRRSVNLQAE
jgi:hypothetical protein